MGLKVARKTEKLEFIYVGGNTRKCSVSFEFKTFARKNAEGFILQSNYHPDGSCRRPPGHTLVRMYMIYDLCCLQGEYYKELRATRIRASQPRFI